MAYVPVIVDGPPRFAMRWLLFALLFVALPVTGSQARDPGGNISALEIYDSCTRVETLANEIDGDTPVDPVSIACFSYLEGIADAISVVSALDDDFDVCIPEDEPLEAIARGFVTFIEDNSTYRSRWAAPVAVLYLMRRYGCEQVADTLR